MISLDQIEERHHFGLKVIVLVGLTDRRTSVRGALRYSGFGGCRVTTLTPFVVASQSNILIISCGQNGVRFRWPWPYRANNLLMAEARRVTMAEGVWGAQLTKASDQKSGSVTQKRLSAGSIDLLSISLSSQLRLLLATKGHPYKCKGDRAKKKRLSKLSIITIKDTHTSNWMMIVFPSHPNIKSKIREVTYVSACCLKVFSDRNIDPSSLSLPRSP